MNHWYVIKTKPHRESDVCHMLQNANLQTFYPKIREKTYRTGKSFLSTKPFFPSYIFLNVDFSQAEKIWMVKFTRGVSHILCAGETPVAVSENIIDEMKKRTTEDDIIVYDQLAHLKPGDMVRIKKGILKDLIGILEKPSSADERVVVLLKLVNYEMKASLHWSELEKLKSAS